MSTGTIQAANKTISKFFESQLIFLSLLGSGALSEGQEVNLSANNTVIKRTSGTAVPIGVVHIGGADAETVTIATVFARTVQGKAIGGTLAAGSLVKPNGNVGTDGRPEYIAAATGDFALGVVIAGGAVNTEIRVGVLRSPITSL